MILNNNSIFHFGVLSKQIVSRFSTTAQYFLDITTLGMPSLSPSMEEGEIVSWRAKEGAPFKEGDVLCSVQTDKAIVDFSATEDGILAKIITPSKERVKVGTPIAYIAENEKELKEFMQKGQSAPVQPTPEPGKVLQPEKIIEKEKKEEAPKTQAQQTQPQEGGALPVGVVELGMPSLSPSMEEGAIAHWNKKEGDRINEGDVICSIQTDKATVDFSATEEGFLAKILKKEGESAKVNTPIALIAEKKEQIPLSLKIVEAKPFVRSPSAPVTQPQQPKKEVCTAAPPVAPAAEAPKVGERVPITPNALQLLEKEVNLSRNDLPDLIGSGKIIPSGQYGSVVLADVEKAISNLIKKAPTAKKAAIQMEEEYTDIPVTAIREVIAKRLSLSKKTIPHYYLSIQVEVDDLIEAREKINKLLEKNVVGKAKPKKISINDMIIKAAANSIRQVPEINSGWIEKEIKDPKAKPELPVIRTWKNIDICVAIQTDAGLIAPVVKKVDTLGMNSISERVKELSVKAKEGKLAPEELTGGSFTISNLGMFGIDHFSAVVNPPQSAILAVGRVQKKVVENPKFNSVMKNENIKESQFKVVQMMEFTLSLDHRVIDGAVGAKFLQKFKELMENPILLSV